MNKIIKGNQFTILWHSKNLKNSYVDYDFIYAVIVDIKLYYVNVAKMTITRGKIHKYLGITTNYSSPVKAKLSMVEYIGKILENIPGDMKGESATTSGHHLFDTYEDRIKLSQSNTDLFHHRVEKLLYLLKQARPYVQLTVSFLCTILIGTVFENYMKLERVTNYTQGTIGVPLIPSMYKYVKIKWCIDEVFEVQKDVSIHTGGFITMGTGGAYVWSRKRKKYKEFNCIRNCWVRQCSDTGDMYPILPKVSGIQYPIQHHISR